MPVCNKQNQTDSLPGYSANLLWQVHADAMCCVRGTAEDRFGKMALTINIEVLQWTWEILVRGHAVQIHLVFAVQEAHLLLRNGVASCFHLLCGRAAPKP